MHKLKAKLTNQDGVSILIALVFFLLCTTVGAVVLTAATANAGRISHMRQDQQDYLTVSSAARLLREELSGQVFRKITTTVSRDGSQAPPVIRYEIPGGALGSTVGEFSKDVCDGLSANLSSSFTVSTDGLSTVNAVLRMDENFNITVELTLEGNRENPMALTVPAVQSHPPAVSTTRDIPVDRVDADGNPYVDLIIETTTVDTFTVTWDEGTIKKGGPP